MEKFNSAHKILEEARQVHAETQTAFEDNSYELVLNRLFQKKFETGESATDYQISSTPTTIDEHDQRHLNDYISAQMSRGLRYDERFSADKWQAVDQLEYKLNDTIINIYDWLPAGYKILFCPKSEIRTGAVSQIDKLIYIFDDIDSWGGLITVLHEVGHVVDGRNLESGIVVPITNGLAPENKEVEKLRSEREASLFALRKIWKELRKSPEAKKDCLLFLKNIAYSSYCEAYFSNVATARYMAHFAQDYDYGDPDDKYSLENWSDWLEFQNSDKYASWKKMDRFANLAEDEEYSHWYEWMVEQDQAIEG